MWRALIIVSLTGAVLAPSAPAFADQTTVTPTDTVKKRTVKKTVVHRRIRAREPRETNTIVPPPVPVATAQLPPGHFVWSPAQQSYTWKGGINRPGAFWVDYILPGVWITQPPAWVWAGTRWN
jgi:hypothetical protein